MDKVLFIVDIQKRFQNSINEDYLNKIKQYLNKHSNEYNHIVMILEENIENGDFISKEVFKKLTIHPVFKCYNESYSINKLKNSKNFSIENGKLKSKITFPDGDFCLKEKDGFIVGSKENNQIFLDYMNRELYLLLNLFRNCEIHIIGGGLNHCVKKTKDYFKFLGIHNTKIKEDLCYEISVQSNYAKDHLFELFIKNKNIL